MEKLNISVFIYIYIYIYVLLNYLLLLAVLFTVTFKFCCHKHACQKEENFVITPVYEGFWEVLVIVSKKSSYSCLWNFKWGDSPLVRWGGGEPALRLGSGQGPLAPWAAQGARRACLWPLQPWHWALARVSCSLNVSAFPGLLGIFTLESSFFCAVCSFSPRASVEQMLVPLKQNCMGKTWEGSVLQLIKAGLPPAAEVLCRRLVSFSHLVARFGELTVDFFSSRYDYHL